MAYGDAERAAARELYVAEGLTFDEGRGAHRHQRPDAKTLVG